MASSQTNIHSLTPLTSLPEDGGPPLGGIDTTSLPPSLELNPAGKEKGTRTNGTYLRRNLFCDSKLGKKQ